MLDLQDVLLESICRESASGQSGHETKGFGIEIRGLSNSLPDARLNLPDGSADISGTRLQYSLTVTLD
jgi:hypothetical protein